MKKTYSSKRKTSSSGTGSLFSEHCSLNFDLLQYSTEIVRIAADSENHVFVAVFVCQADRENSMNSFISLVIF